MATKHIQGTEVGKEVAAFGPAIAAHGSNSSFMADIGAMFSPASGHSMENRSVAPSHGLKCAL